MEIAVIQNKIYEIRGQKVMIDRDLAEMYGVQTKALNQAVKRNIERFPEDFMFQLTTEETQNWKSQIVTTNSIKMGLRRNPYAFTELGVAMLSSVLTSKIAIQVNIGIMRAFVAVRQYLLSANNPTQEIEDLKQRVKELEESSEDTLAAINDLSEDTRKELDDIYLALTELAEKKKLPNCNKIGYVAIQERRNEK